MHFWPENTSIWVIKHTNILGGKFSNFSEFLIYFHEQIEIFEIKEYNGPHCKYQKKKWIHFLIEIWWKCNCFTYPQIVAILLFWYVLWLILMYLQVKRPFSWFCSFLQLYFLLNLKNGGMATIYVRPPPGGQGGGAWMRGWYNFYNL